MKRFKKIFSLLLAAALAVSVCCTPGAAQAAEIDAAMPAGQSASHVTSESILEETWETAGNAENAPLNQADSIVKLQYDDRHTFSKKVKSIKTLEITSTQAGSAQADKAVLKTADSGKKKVIACGCGQAAVTFSDGSTCTVQVSAAPISLLMIAGQSNGEGRPSSTKNLSTYKKQWIVNEEGQVYNTYAPSTVDKTNGNMFTEVGWYGKTGKVLSIHNVSSFVPSSLTNNTSSDPWMRTNNLTNASTATGKGGIDSALAYRWCQLTGEKVWIINAAHRGSSIKSWQPGSEKTNNNFWQAVLLYQKAEKILSKEIKAGHYRLSHKGVFWLQGEKDMDMSASTYLKYFKKMNNGFRKQLKGTDISGMKKALEFTGILMVRAGLNNSSSKDLAMTGPRLAQSYMATSTDSAYSKVYLASQITDSWYNDQSVANYFKSSYGSQSKYKAAYHWASGTFKMPTKISQLHSTIHYSQLAYNELGRDAANNICYALGYAPAPAKKVTSVKIVTANGYTNRAGKTIKVKKGSNTAVAVRVYPTYYTKRVKIKTTKGLTRSVSGVKLTNSKTNAITATADGKQAKLTVKKKS